MLGERSRRSPSIFQYFKEYTYSVELQKSPTYKCISPLNYNNKICLIFSLFHTVYIPRGQSRESFRCGVHVANGGRLTMLNCCSELTTSRHFQNYVFSLSVEKVTFSNFTSGSWTKNERNICFKVAKKETYIFYFDRNTLANLQIPGKFAAIGCTARSPHTRKP